MPERATLEEVLERYETAVVALERLQGTKHAELALLNRFAGLSRVQVVEALAAARLEVEGQALVALVGAAEADLRKDLEARHDGVKNDPIRAKAQELTADTDGKPRLEDLIDLWREASGEAGHGAGSRLKSLLRRRHWLAHGRHWPDRSGVRVDAADAYSTIERFRGRIRTVDPKFPRG